MQLAREHRRIRTHRAATFSFTELSSFWSALRIKPGDTNGSQGPPLLVLKPQQTTATFPLCPNWKSLPSAE